MPGWKIGLLIGLALVIVAPIVALQVLPWWGTLVVLLVEVGLITVLGPRWIRWGVTQITMDVLGRKSRVLAGAEVEIHQMKLVDRPAGASEEDDARYVEVECTIMPRPGAAEIPLYEPGELLLVPYESPVSETEHPEEGAAATVAQVQVVDETGAEQAEPERISGPARLRIVFACPLSLRGRAKLRYYFEQFGDLTLP